MNRAAPPPESILRSGRFRADREADWSRLEALLRRIEGGSAARLAPDELLEVPVLYRSALSSLSTARSISLDQGLIDYLEDLCTRAYFVVYGVRASFGERVARFFAEHWPDAVRGLWKETLAAGLLTSLAASLAFVLVQADPGWFSAFVPDQVAAGRDPGAAADALRTSLYSEDREALTVFAAFLFTHNAQIAILAFALGFAFGAPTAALLVFNGLTLGAFVALFASRGLGAEFVGWLAIHGVTELLAVVLAGAAGLSIGWALAFPGDRTRSAAAAHAGRRAGVVMLGVVIMLFAAGLLEGFGRQLVRADWARYAIALLTAGLWAAYFYLPRARR